MLYTMLFASVSARASAPSIYHCSLIRGFFFAINNMATTWIPVLVATHTFVLTPPISDVPCADTRQATSNIERKSKENKKETKNNVSKLFGILRFFSILFRF